MTHTMHGLTSHSMAIAMSSDAALVRAARPPGLRRTHIVTARSALLESVGMKPECRTGRMSSRVGPMFTIDAIH